MIGLIVCLLTFFWGGDEYGFSTLGVDAFQGNECGIQVQNYVQLLQESGMTAEYHYKNWIFCI